MSKAPKKQYTLRLNEENAETCKEIVEKLGLTLPKFIDQVLAGWVAVFKKSNLHEKDFSEWTMDDMARFYSVFRDAQPHDPNTKEDNQA